MLRVVDDRRQWLRDHPLEVAIVLLTPPFMPASLQAARLARLLRLLRLLRLGLLVRRRCPPRASATPPCSDS
jgi:voltage-gated potassium channel